MIMGSVPFYSGPPLLAALATGLVAFALFSCIATALLAFKIREGHVWSRSPP